MILCLINVHQCYYFDTKKYLLHIDEKCHTWDGWKVGEGGHIRWGGYIEAIGCHQPSAHSSQYVSICFFKEYSFNGNGLLFANTYLIGTKKTFFIYRSSLSLHIKSIFILLFQRLQSSKTTKFVKGKLLAHGDLKCICTQFKDCYFNL